MTPVVQNNLTLTLSRGISGRFAAEDAALREGA